MDTEEEINLRPNHIHVIWMQNLQPVNGVVTILPTSHHCKGWEITHEQQQIAEFLLSPVGWWWRQLGQLLGQQGADLDSSGTCQSVPYLPKLDLPPETLHIYSC